MFRFVLLLSALLSVVAFAPVSRVSRASALKMRFETAEGAQPPLGFWDPLGLLKDADEARFNNLRFVELKHGRIAMLAVLGHLTAAYNRLPGTIDLDGTKFSDIPNGLGALSAIPALGLVQLILSIGWWELKGWKQVEGSTPGDFGIRYLQFLDTPEKQAKARAQELNQGRAAQMGILALMVHEELNGSPYVINDLLGLPIGFPGVNHAFQ